MRRAPIAGGTVATLLVVLAIALAHLGPEHDIKPAAMTSSAAIPPTRETREGLLYGRITTDDGAVYEGRLRWGGDEEALWGNYFNGRKEGNPWAAHAPRELLPKERVSLGAFGVELLGWDHTVTLSRPFMARFGDIALIEPSFREIRVTLKNGAVSVLDRFEADDLADGVRVWDANRGVVNLGEWGIRSIELLPAPETGTGPLPVHGTVRTRMGEFTGLLQWGREESLGSDELSRRTADGELINLRLETICSIARRSRDSSLVTLLDGREIVISGPPGGGRARRGLYVDDPRYGRVLISWDVFERVDLSRGGMGPAYDDFPPGYRLTGSVVTRSGRRLAGRLIYDLDESETTDTLDAPSQGVHYTIPFGLVASIVPPGSEERGTQRATVTLHGGEELRLERSDDLGRWNAGMLIFVDGRRSPEYVPWTEVARVEFDRPPEMYPPVDLR